MKNSPLPEQKNREHGPAGRRDDATRTLRALEAFCEMLAPGDRIPTHKELMRRFQASERAVLRALDEMQRQGKITRRNGIGTFVAPREAPESREKSLAGASRIKRAIIAVAQPDHSFFDCCMKALFRYAESSGLDLMCQIIGSEADALPVPDPENRPLGYLFFRYHLAPVAAQMQAGGCRVVLVGSPPAGVGPEIPCVYGDQEQGGYLALSHILALGHRRVAFAHPGEDLPLQWRWRGYQRALREAALAGQKVETSLLLAEQTDEWSGQPALASAFFRAQNAPTALVAWNDHEAAALLTSLTRGGVRVPQDVSLIGYDALPEGRRVFPSLTTVDHGISQQMQAAVRLLTQNGPLPPEATVFAPALISRESTTRRI